jgi:hypothetical protein
MRIVHARRQIVDFPEIPLPSGIWRVRFLAGGESSGEQMLSQHSPSLIVVMTLLAVAGMERPSRGAVEFLSATRTVSVTVSPFNGTSVRPEDMVSAQRLGLAPENFTIERRLPDSTSLPTQRSLAQQDSAFAAERFDVHALLEYDDSMLSTGSDSRVAATSAIIAVALDSPTPWRLDVNSTLDFRRIVGVSHRLLVRDAGGTLVFSRLVVDRATAFSGELGSGRYTFELNVQIGSVSALPSAPQARYESWQALTLPAPSVGLIVGPLVFGARRRNRD